METVKCRKIGGSIVIAIPVMYVKELGLTKGMHLDMVLSDGKLFLTPREEERKQIKVKEVSYGIHLQRNIP